MKEGGELEGIRFLQRVFGNRKDRVINSLTGETQKLELDETRKQGLF